MAKALITTTANNSLLSFTPSRPFFPRGFLWDEGFHLLPVIEWDLDLAVSVVRSWLNLMDEDGWIGRKFIDWRTLANFIGSLAHHSFEAKYTDMECCR